MPPNPSEVRRAPVRATWRAALPASWHAQWRESVARRLLPALGSVRPVAPGLDGDGFAALPAAPYDPGAPDTIAIGRDALEAWRANPLARRLVGLTTSYCVGDGIRLTSPYPPLDGFLRRFWAHAGTRIDLELPDWSDELARSGELFLALFTDVGTGLSSVRAVPAAAIDRIEWEEGDYRTETGYRDISAGRAGAKWWKSQHHPELHLLDPVLLHFAVNRPVGALRGESDLGPILPWLRRYSRWLEDRVRLNAAVRSFLWVVNAPARVRAGLVEQYRKPPEPGSVILADESERWTAVTPSLHAADAEKDGRAIRWMITAAGPGTALLDLGEGEDSNLATGQVMQEQKRRFLRRRQRFLVHMLTELALVTWRRYALIMLRPGEWRDCSAEDIVALAPDISPEDNAQLSLAAAQMVGALRGLGEITGEGAAQSVAYKRLALRLFMRFAGEPLSADELDRLVEQQS